LLYTIVHRAFMACLFRAPRVLFTQAAATRRSISMAASLEDVKNLSELKAPPVLVFFTASWCEPCRAVMPHFQDISSRFEGPLLKMAQVDVTDLPDAARDYRVDAVPYFLVLRDGHVVERLAGNGPEEIEQVAEKHALAFQKLQEESR
ncbi:Thioredoxin H-type (Trx-H), partial [Durusdinium trenchii]